MEFDSTNLVDLASNQLVLTVAVASDISDIRTLLQGLISISLMLMGMGCYLIYLKARLK